MKLPVDRGSQTISIKRVPPVEYVNNQKVPSSGILIATVKNADIQPLSGREILSASKNGYDADFQGFIGLENITFETGYSDIKSGDILYDASLQPYKIVFPGYFRNSHYEPLLKLRG